MPEVSGNISKISHFHKSLLDSEFQFHFVVVLFVDTDVIIPHFFAKNFHVWSTKASSLVRFYQLISRRSEILSDS